MHEAPRARGFAVGALIGEGGGARVFAATDAEGREVALKVLRTREADDPVAAARMRREARVLAGVEHPGVVRALGSGVTEDGRLFLALERVEGPTLEARIAAGGPLAPREAWALVRGLADALAAVHARGLLHRDLSSRNVLLDRRGRARLTDFGLARPAAGDGVSRDGASVGTPAYMAPEQWWGAGLDERTDVYGLGALLFECLTGAPPWAGEEPAELLHRVATAEAPRAAERGSDVPLEVDAFVAACLSRQPDGRPADVGRFVALGDAAFAHRRPLERAAPWAAGLLTALAPTLIGYGGSHDPRAWSREAGWASYLIGASALVALPLLARFVRTRALLPLLPLAQGAVGFATGLAVVLAAVEGLAPEQRFATFELGVAEASAGWFLGAALTAALFVIVALLDRAIGRPRAREFALAALLGGVGLLAGGVGPALTGALAGGLVLSGAARQPATALAALGAVSSFTLLTWVERLGAASRLWHTELSRAQRALAFAELSQAQVSALGAGLVAVVVLAAMTSWRGVRAWPGRRVVLGGAGLLALGAALLGPALWMLAERGAHIEALTPRLGQWSRLEPPSLPPSEAQIEPARLGPTLQLGRATVAVDGAPVMPTDALASRTGALLLATRLGPALHLARTPQLVVAADRSLPTSALTAALRVARDLGVSRVDLLLLPGAPLRLSASAPAEASLVLPADLRRVQVQLSGGEPPEGRYDVALPRLAREAAYGLGPSADASAGLLPSGR